MLSHFHLILERNGQTDRLTDLPYQCRASVTRAILQRHINCIIIIIILPWDKIPWLCKEGMLKWTIFRLVVKQKVVVQLNYKMKPLHRHRNTLNKNKSWRTSPEDADISLRWLNNWRASSLSVFRPPLRRTFGYLAVVRVAAISAAALALWAEHSTKQETGLPVCHGISEILSGRFPSLRQCDMGPLAVRLQECHLREMLSIQRHYSAKAEFCDWCGLFVCRSVCEQDNTRTRNLQMSTKRGRHGQLRGTDIVSMKY